MYSIYRFSEFAIIDFANKKYENCLDEISIPDVAVSTMANITSITHNKVDIPMFIRTKYLIDNSLLVRDTN